MNSLIVEIAIRSSIIAAACLIVRALMFRASAHTKAKVLTIGLIGLLVLPVAMLVLPEVSVVVARTEEIVRTTGVTQDISSPVPATPEMPIAWIALGITTLLLTRFVVTLIQFARLRRSMAPAPAGLALRVKSLSSLARTVLFSPQGEPPMTWGVVEPTIALPAESEAWMEPQFRSVVLHEDAHIRRRDWLISIGFRFATAMLWFNPLVWAMKALYERDSEQAADDFVLSNGVEASEYAERLVEIARQLTVQKNRFPAVTMAKSSRLKSRLGSILSPNANRKPMRGMANLTVVGSLAACVVSAGVIGPVIEHVKISSPDTWNTPAAPENPDQDFVISDKSPESPSSIERHSNEVCAPEPPSTGQSQATQTSQTKVTTVNRTIDESNHQQASTKKIVHDALRDARKEVSELDMKSEMDAIDSHTRAEIDRSIAEASKEVDRSLKDAQAEIDKAMKEYGKTEMPKGTLEFANGISKMSLKLVGNMFKGKSEKKEPNAKTKPSKQKPSSETNSDSPVTNATGGDSDNGNR